MHVVLIITGLQFSLVIMGVVLSVVWVRSYFVTPFEISAYAHAPIICNSLLLQVMLMCRFSEKITDVISLLISISIKLIVSMTWSLPMPWLCYLLHVWFRKLEKTD